LSGELTKKQRAFVRRLVELEGAMAAPPPDEDGLDEFRTLIMARWENIRWRLLGATADRLRALSEPQRSLLQTLQDSPDLLAPLERQRDEVFHTRLIAWFLDQEDEVGRGCRRSLADELGIEVDMSVHAEVVVAKGCRVDLVIETARHLVYIEAKVEAAERPEQLADYRRALTANAGKRKGLLVFLTLNGTSNASAKHRPLTFEQLLALWLPATLARGPSARYLASYLVTVAHDLCGVIGVGPFHSWSLVQQHRILDLLNRVDVPDA